MLAAEARCVDAVDVVESPGSAESSAETMEWSEWWVESSTAWIEMKTDSSFHRQHGWRAILKNLNTKRRYKIFKINEHNNDI